MTSAITTLKLILHIVIDVVILTSVSAAYIMMGLIGVPVQRGFMCDDDSIRYPHYPDSVTITLLVIVGISMPTTSIVVLEAAYKLMWSRGTSGRVKQFFVSVIKLLALMAHGLALVVVLTSALKLATGRLRPHFLHDCKPDLTNCTSRHYMENIVCTSDADSHTLKDARSSFPSGHSSFAMYLATFTCLYVEQRMITPFSVLFKSVLQLAVMFTGLLVCVSRVVDLRHHPGDVIAGGLLGSGVAVWVFFVLVYHLNNESVTNRAGDGNAVVAISAPSSPRTSIAHDGRTEALRTMMATNEQQMAVLLDDPV